MRRWRWFLLGLLVGMNVVCWSAVAWSADELKFPPPLPSEPPDEQSYFRELFNHIARCPSIAVSPATRTGKRGDCVLAVYGGNTRACLNTGNGPGPTTTWLCVTLSAP